MRRAETLTSFLSPLLFVAMFVFLPGYVFWSLTDWMRHMPAGQAALMDFLVAPILYVTVQSAVLGVAATWGALVPSARGTAFRRIATAFAAALPPAYLLLFAARFAGHLAVPEAPLPSGWPIVIVSVLACAASLALTTYFSSERRTSVSRAIGKSVIAGVVLCYLVAWLGGFNVRFDVIELGPLFWIVHMALVPPFMLVAILVLAAMAKAIICITGAIVGTETVLVRPYLVAGATNLVVAASAGWAAAIL
jgi:hypothetical protein